MTGHRALDEAALRTLLSAIEGTSWSWREQDLSGLATRFGWDGIRILPGRGAFVDPGHGIGYRAYRLSFDGAGRVNIITMRISSKVDEDDAMGQLFLADVFADALVVATGIMGAPTARIPGSAPEVRWRGAESTLILEMLSICVELVWASNAYQDHWDSLD
jgi:hypothetical protein